MKHKLLTFLFALCLIIPCGIILTACGPSDPPPSNPPPGSTGSLTVGEGTARDVTFLHADAENIDDMTDTNDGRYSVWIADYFNKDTLRVYYDNQPVDLTYCNLDGYEQRVLGFNQRKIATFSIPAFDPGDHVVSYTVEEEEITLTFVSPTDGLTDSEMDVLSDWYLSDANKSFSEIIDTDYELKTTFTQLTRCYREFENNDILITCGHSIGYYKYPAQFDVVSDGVEYGTGSEYVGGEERNQYALLVMPFTLEEGFADRSLQLTPKKEHLALSRLRISGDNAYNEILSAYYEDGDPNWGVAGNKEWTPNSEESVKIYLNERAGADLSEVEVYIYDTLMELHEDEHNQGKRYFEIPAGDLPADYYEIDLNAVSYDDATLFEVIIKGVKITEGYFATDATISSNNSDIITGMAPAKYYQTEDTMYYIEGRTTSAHFSFGSVTSRPQSIKFKDESANRTIDISSYVYLKPSVPIAGSEDGYDAWRYAANNEKTEWWYNYKIKIGEKDAIITLLFNDQGNIDILSLEFLFTGNTDVQLIF